MQIGIFTIPEGLIFPKTNKELRHDMRAFARGIDLDLQFRSPKKGAPSYCDPINRRAVVSDTYSDGSPQPLIQVAHTALHECAHWMDIHNGLFRDYYSRPGYKHVINPKKKDIMRLGVRAERHCDWLANRMLWVMYGRTHNDCHYDHLGAARLALITHYDLE